MAGNAKRRLGPRTRERLLGRLDAMIKSGRVTETEAARLRTAAEGDEFESAIVDISARHVGTRLDSAVGAGDMSRQEADAVLERVRSGEHSSALRAHLRKLLPGSRPAGRVPDGR
ncbi:MAG TPA: hypothetical protein VGH93_09380 [Solirubrobacteraceae bacterium]|jgi:hypothetical protein